jgi:hypothetical protein
MRARLLSTRDAEEVSDGSLEVGGGYRMARVARTFFRGSWPRGLGDGVWPF